MRVMELGAGDQAAMITSFARREAGRSVASGVPDPIGGPDEEYSETFDLLDDLIERAEKFKNELIIVTHFSTRYHEREIERTIQSRLPDSLRDRGHLWL